MSATGKTPKVTGLKLTGLTIPLFPDKESELRSYGDELALYLNNAKRDTKWLPYSEGAAQMLRRWASKLPEPPPSIIKDIAQHTESIRLQSSQVVALRRAGRVEPILSVELDIPTPLAAVAFLMATILSAGYGKHLRQCGMEGCAVWFFDIAEGRRTREYCCEAHSNRQRQREYRERVKTKQRRHRK